MATLATMRSNIATFINRSDMNTQIDLAINRAIKFYSRLNRFWFNETTGTFATVANQLAYGTADGVPSTLLKVDNLEIAINSTDNVRLIPRTYRYIQEANVANTAGTPSDYAYYQSKFYIYPVPDAVYTITISYLKSYADLSADSDNNDFTNNAEDLIEARAMWWIFKRMLRNFDAANDAKNEELEALLALQRETTRLISTGRVRPETF